MQDQLRINRQIFFDLASRYLEGLPGRFARLTYLANLRDAARGIYAHPDLSLVYPAEVLHEAISKCHEEIFESFLELTLLEQHREFIQFLQSNGQAIPEDPAERWQLFESWVSPRSPVYLKELFLANLQALSETASGPRSKVRSGK